MTDSRFILKILSGLHVGAEFYLPLGVTRLGKSPDCDIILHDQGLADEHLIFRCSGQETLVECPTQASAALLNGADELHEQGPYTIGDYGLITSAGLYLALGVADACWDIPPPARLFTQFLEARRTAQPAPEQSQAAANADHAPPGDEKPGPQHEELAPEHGSARSEDELEALGNELVGQDELVAGQGEPAALQDEPAAMQNELAALGTDPATAQDDPAAASGQESAAGGAEQTGRAPGHRVAAPAFPQLWRRVPRRARVMGAGALAVVALCAGLFYWHGKSQPVAEVAHDPGMTLAEIERVAADFKLDASFELLDKNLLQVSGYALNSAEKHEFVRAMYARGVIVKSRLVLTEQFKNNILNILEQLVNPARHEAISVSVKPDDIRTLVLRGYVQDAEKWQAALAETMRQVDAIAYEDEVAHWDDGYGHLQELIESHDASALLRLQDDRENDRILLFATDYHNADEPRLQALAQEYRQRYARPELLLPGPGEQETLNLPAFTASKILGASFNVLNYVLLDDGQRYFVGSLTPDGYRIDEINETFAIFSLAGTDYVHYFDEPDKTMP